MTIEEFETEIQKIFKFQDFFVVKTYSEFEYKKIIIFEKDILSGSNFDEDSNFYGKYQRVEVFSDTWSEAFKQALDGLKEHITIEKGKTR